LASLIASHGQAKEGTVLNLAGKTSLRELCAALKAAQVLLTNDTGPMHVGAALGTPVVALFGSTASELTGPGLPEDGLHGVIQAKVPCAPCFRRECPIDFRCMMSISVETVVEAVLRLVRFGKSVERMYKCGGKNEPRLDANSRE
jgi:heptosyltransferase-2